MPRAISIIFSVLVYVVLYMDALAQCVVAFVYARVFFTVFCPFTPMRWIHKTLVHLIHFPYRVHNGNCRHFVGMSARDGNEMVEMGVGPNDCVCMCVCVVTCALYSRRYMRFLHIRLCGKINFAQLSLLIKLVTFRFHIYMQGNNHA